MVKIRCSTVWRILVGVLFALFFIYSWLPIPAGHDHVGVWVCLGVAVAGLAVTALWPLLYAWVAKRKAVLYMVVALACIAAILLVLFFTASGFMLAGALSRPVDEGHPVTVVVLGAAARVMVTVYFLVVPLGAVTVMVRVFLPTDRAFLPLMEVLASLWSAVALRDRVVTS